MTVRKPQIGDLVAIEGGKHADKVGRYVRDSLVYSGQTRLYPVVALPGEGEVRVTSVALVLTFTKGVRCGGCGEILPDQEGVARDCLCIRIDAIECVCPDANLETSFYLDYCPKHGIAAPTNEAAADDRGPWYGGQQTAATRPSLSTEVDR
jgi:hypothetical protein